MTLADELAELRTQARQSLTEATWDALDHANQAVSRRLAGRTPVVGDRVPDVVLVDGQGNERTLGTLTQTGPVVLSFYRGSWCPFCQLELKALHGASELVERLGARIVAASPERLKHSCSAGDCSQAGKMGVEMLRDPHNAAARSFGLVYTVLDRVQPLYEEAGVDLRELNEDEDWELPVPATYVIDSALRARFAYVEADYTQRVDPAEVLRALRDLARAA